MRAAASLTGLFYNPSPSPKKKTWPFLYPKLTRPLLPSFFFFFFFGGGGRETGRERGKQGVARLCVCVCMCVHVCVCMGVDMIVCVCVCMWIQGRGKDKVRYVMQY